MEFVKKCIDSGHSTPPAQNAQNWLVFSHMFAQRLRCCTIMVPSLHSIEFLKQSIESGQSHLRLRNLPFAMRIRKEIQSRKVKFGQGRLVVHSVMNC